MIERGIDKCVCDGCGATKEIGREQQRHEGWAWEFHTEYPGGDKHRHFCPDCIALIPEAVKINRILDKFDKNSPVGKQKLAEEAAKEVHKALTNAQKTKEP